MKSNKEKFLNLVSKIDTSWIEEVEKDIANTLEREANAIIALKIRRYMITNSLKQKDLAEKLSVTPQYVNKLLRGGENLGIGTALKFGEILGITLIQKPSLEDSPIVKTIIKTDMLYDKYSFAIHIPKMKNSILSKSVHNIFSVSNYTESPKRPN